VSLIPRDKGFFILFNSLAEKMKTSAEQLAQMFAEPQRLDHFVAAIKNTEHEADAIAHEVSQRIDKSFITPLDREDIHNLAQELDNVVDLIDGTARRVAMFKIRDSRPYASELAKILQKSVGSLQAAVLEIKNPRVVATRAREVKVFEEEGDAMYQRAVGELFLGTPDPIDVIKWKEIYDTLEDALDRCQTAAQVIESISLKNS
jgi:predicted phosphate transport protein (TIGR00153 family)